MAGITGLGTTYNLPNYTGLLYQLSRSETPFFSAIGGLSGGRQTTETAFEWQTFDLRDAAQDASRRSRKKANKAAKRLQGASEAQAEALLESANVTGRKARKNLDQAVERARSARHDGSGRAGELIDRLG